MSTETQNQIVQREFTKQAQAYGDSATVSNAERIERLIAAVNPAPDARVLEVATGPGHIALAFAAHCREVVAIDLTEAMLERAEARRQERGIANVRFQPADAQALPFADGEFDAAVSRWAIHHFAEPGQVLAEIARVVRPGGRVVIEDAIVSEQPERAAYQNRFEHLSDPSHTAALPLSALLSMFGRVGLEVDAVNTGGVLLEVERWMGVAQTPPERAAEVRALIQRDAAEDLSGTRPFYREGELFFTSRTATVVGRKLG